ncbi:MAG TPA: DUF6326 family protein [Candidatus Bathyarchaeia archaeon]|nr:DUF6326 family protein [Candidatus Bathyarchaeia archaeon]
MEDYRIKISVLWLFVALAVVSAGMLAIIEPGGIANLTAGQLEGEQLSPAWLLFLAVFVLVPLVMAFLSLTLKASVNRWAHVIVGVIFAILSLPKLVQAIQQLYAAATLMKLAGIVALALIVWYAWTS